MRGAIHTYSIGGRAFTQQEWGWQDWYNYRIKTGGTKQAATMLANMRCPDEAKPVPPYES